MEKHASGTDPRLRQMLWLGAFDRTRDPTPGANHMSPYGGGTPSRFTLTRGT
jgi:hypothetical protein